MQETLSRPEENKEPLDGRFEITAAVEKFCWRKEEKSL